jgi:hypothetical protein
VLGVPRPPVHLVSANVGLNQTLPLNGSIELGFDRLLLPASVTRQTFVLENAGLENAGNAISYTPTVAYDPVARIVTITPLASPQSQMLVSGQSYKIVILAPQNGADPNGLRAFDGATLAEPAPIVIAFSVTDATPTLPSTVSIDFCRDIFPITDAKCSLSICHGGSGPMPAPAAGLVLDPPSGIPTTAVGRVAQGSNTGPRSVASPPSLLFGEDMPIIDATNDPGNSWLMYKVLLATPSPEPVVDAGASGSEDAGAPDATTDAGGPGSGAEAGAPEVGADAGALEADASAADASAADASTDAAAEAGVPSSPPIVPPVNVAGAHALPWQPIPAAERASLSNYVLGREMPFPPVPGQLNSTTSPLTVDEMERLSLWISQGAAAPATCP